MKKEKAIVGVSYTLTPKTVYHEYGSYETHEISIGDFLKVADVLPLTRPQREFMHHIACGYKLKVINSHWRSGGTIVWDLNGANHYAGRISSVLKHVYWAVEKFCEVRSIDVPGLWIKDLGI